MVAVLFEHGFEALPMMDGSNVAASLPGNAAAGGQLGMEQESLPDSKASCKRCNGNNRGNHTCSKRRCRPHAAEPASRPAKRLRSSRLTAEDNRMDQGMESTSLGSDSLQPGEVFGPDPGLACAGELGCEKLTPNHQISNTSDAEEGSMAFTSRATSNASTERPPLASSQAPGASGGIISTSFARCTSSYPMKLLLSRQLVVPGTYNYYIEDAVGEQFPQRQDNVQRSHVWSV